MPEPGGWWPRAGQEGCGAPCGGSEAGAWAGLGEGVSSDGPSGVLAGLGKPVLWWPCCTARVRFEAEKGLWENRILGGRPKGPRGPRDLSPWYSPGPRSFYKRGKLRPGEGERLPQATTRVRTRNSGPALSAFLRYLLKPLNLESLAGF